MLDISNLSTAIFSWPRAGCLALQSKVRLDYGASTKCRDRRYHAPASMAASDKSRSPKGLDGTSAVYWDIFMNTFLWCLVLPSWLPQKGVERWPSEQVEQLYRPSTCSNSMGTAVLQEHRRQTFDRGCIVVKHLDHHHLGGTKNLWREIREWYLVRFVRWVWDVESIVNLQPWLLQTGHFSLACDSYETLLFSQSLWREVSLQSLRAGMFTLNLQSLKTLAKWPCGSANRRPTPQAWKILEEPRQNCLKTRVCYSERPKNCCFTCFCYLFQYLLLTIRDISPVEIDTSMVPWSWGTLTRKRKRASASALGHLHVVHVQMIANDCKCTCATCAILYDHNMDFDNYLIENV